LSPRAITAVLSGGGAKAAAHLGALQVLRGAGLVPSRYVGTSMGAVIAAMIAAGLTPGEVTDRLLAVRRGDIFRLDRTSLWRGLFARSLLRPEPFRRVLESLVPATAFSELTVPLSVTATDLDSGALLVFGEGGETVPLLDALCASSALPPFFPPYRLTGRRCADGGLRAVVPLEVAGRFPADLVIAIDVGAGFDTAIEPDARPAPALLQLQNDAQRVLMASNTSAQHALWLATPGRPSLLWIRPQVRRGETFATEQLRWYLAEGERAARAALAEPRS
jgi:NTE family protein